MRATLPALALLASACSAAPGVPVHDAADILSPQAEKALADRLQGYRETRETAIVVATVPSLKGETIDVTARRMYADKGVGVVNTSRGVLVLVAPAERKARIEVGCGLETVVTNAAAKQVLDDAMLPQFREGAFDAGVRAGVEALITRIETAKVTPGPVSPYCVKIMKDAA